MVRGLRGRWAVLVTLALLQMFTITAGVYVSSRGVSPALSGAALAQGPPTPSASATPVPLLTSAPVLSTGPDGPPPARNTLAARLAGPLADSSLGRSVGAVVMDAASGATLFGSRATAGITPASTTKVVTGAAALTSLGPDTRLTTRVVYGAGKNSIILVGGGDPTLAGPKASARTYPRSATLAGLAARTAKALKAAGIAKVALSYDDSLFSGPRTAPGWKPNYVPEGTVAPVTALMIDEGRVNPRSRQRSADPSRATATAFASLLTRYGIKVAKGVGRAKAGQSARDLAWVDSPPVYQLVERMLTLSDNDLAEALAHQVAIKEGRPGTFAHATQAVHRVLRRLGADEGIQVFDGSGLSTGNRITPAALAHLLALAASPENPELHSLISGLPVAGFSGTLHDRYDRPGSEPGAGLVRAKTGSLNGVNTLTGIARTSAGRLVTFAFMADKVPSSGRAIATLDRLASIVSAA